jgi:hypothetical protein
MTASDLHWVVDKDTNFLVHVKETYGNIYQLRVPKYAISSLFRSSSLTLERISNTEVI